MECIRSVLWKINLRFILKPQLKVVVHHIIITIMVLHMGGTCLLLLVVHGKILFLLHPFLFTGTAAWGPGIPTGTGGSFALGLNQDGVIESNNPYVWFYTGTTSTRVTESTDDWYLGVSALTANEGDGNAGPDIGRVNANIGKFYYESQLNKFRILWPTYNSLLNWVTYDPRVDYGQPGNPVSISLTGATSGLTVQNLDNVGVYDYTINASNTVILASSIYPDGGALGKSICGG